MKYVIAEGLAAAKRGTTAQRCAQARQPLRHYAPRTPRPLPLFMPDSRLSETSPR